jgi:hypothetical protein
MSRSAGLSPFALPIANRRSSSLRTRALRFTLLSLVLTSAIPAPLLAKPSHGSASHSSQHGQRHQGQPHPAYWKRDPNRWDSTNWNRSYRHNHWDRPCGGLGCNPRTWSPTAQNHRWDPNWNRNRPWRHGWYGPRYYNGWGWWAPQATAWGIGTLATTATISAAVSAAIEAQQNTIVVPSSSYLLDYRSIQVPADNVVTFVVQRDGQRFQMDADCADGELNGHAPTSAAEAQLLNAACQVAFGGS